MVTPMLTTGLRNSSTPSKRRDQTSLWLSLSLIVTGIYGWVGVRGVFGSQYLFHDDVRSHVFWMRRFIDPELFPQDLIADYFQSVAPYGYTALYRVAVGFGIDPVFFNKVLPIGLVAITAIYCFGTCLRLLNLPAAAFMATVFLNQNIWATHDVASGTPRAFLYPLFLAFLYYLLGRSLFPCTVAIALQGFFYPQCLFLSAGILILRLFRLKKWQLCLSRQAHDYVFCTIGLVIVGLMLMPYALKVSDFGPVTTAAEGRNLPVLQSTGRKNFFYNDPWKFWFCGERCGMVPYDWCKYFPPPQFWITLSLPFLFRYPNPFPLTEKATRHIVILPQILLASLGMFFAAHALLFKLHLPSRYTKHSLRILVALGAGVALVIILDAVWRAIKRRTKAHSRKRQVLTVSCLIPLIALLFGYPFLLEEYPNPDYVEAETPAIYEFFAQQPKDILVASLSEQANNIPTLSQRSVLVSSEVANPYHLGYYRLIQERTHDLMNAQYAPSLAVAKALIEKYGVDFILVDREAFTPDYIKGNSWLREQPNANEAIARLREGQLPALAGILDCSVFEADNRVILGADCVMNAESDHARADQ